MTLSLTSVKVEQMDEHRTSPSPSTFLSSVPSPRVRQPGLSGKSLSLGGRGGQVSSGLPHLKGQSCEQSDKVLAVCVRLFYNQERVTRGAQASCWLKQNLQN